MSMRLTEDGLAKLGADMQRIGKRLPMAVQNALEGEGGEAIISNMRQLMPVKTGKTVAGLGIHKVGASVYVGYLGSLTGGIVQGGRDQRGVWIETGTRPHAIRAKDGGALLLPNGAEPVEEVQHPGTKGQRIGRKSLRRSQWEVEAAVVDEIAALTKGIG